MNIWVALEDIHKCMNMCTHTPHTRNNKNEQLGSHLSSKLEHFDSPLGKLT